MAINIKFDLVGNPEPPTIILSTRSGKKLGQLKVDENSIDLSGKFNDASEFSFTMNKYYFDEKERVDRVTHLWDKVVDFKLVYCKEWDMWFEIKVELDEETETVKTVFCTQLGQAELSQINLYNIEINTEEDIERDDYKITILYNEKDKKASLLDRLLEKAPHYSIIHVDDTIRNIQRSFSFDGTSIKDAFDDIAEEIGCLFVYHSNSGENGKIQRTISVYDLEQNCIDCGHRGEFIDKCPKCNSTNIKYGYGEDTLIFVTADELASGGISLTTDTDAVKNCFKLEAGDDLMTATVRNCNPNGSDYIWYFSDAVKEDMSEELVEKIESYDKEYKYRYNDSVSDINEDLLNDYNSLVEKYSEYNEDLQEISMPITGYSALMNAYYNTIDLALYLESGLMPSIEMSKTNATEQAALLTSSALSPVAVTNVNIASLATMNSAVLAMAKIIVKSTYKVQIKSSETYVSGDSKYWKGNFIVTNYSDEEDTAESNVVSVKINDDLETVTKQKIEKILNKEDTDDYSVTGLFEKEYDDFCLEIKKYALNPLVGFRDACQSCIDILIEQGIGDSEFWRSDDEGSESNLYETLYTPYYNKLKAIESEIKVREDEINVIVGVYDTDGNLVTKGLQTYIEECRNQIQDDLNFEKYLDELWLEFCCYRREDTYSNENYISDGLDNAELFKKALEFIEAANNEIYKSSELQCSISTTLNNLLAIKKFKPLVDSFELGNWIRIQVDDKIYKLRLLEYGISFGDFNDISVEFSDVTKIKNGITDVKDVLAQASSMATSYDSVQRQSKQGDEANQMITDWYLSGLNSTLVNIKNNDNEEITFNNNGILARSYDDINDSYSPEQLRITHNVIALTDDNWETSSLGIGKHNYNYYDSTGALKQGIGYGVSAKFLSAGYVNGSQIIGGEIFSQNFSATSGTYINLNNGTFSWAGGRIKYDGINLILSGVNLTWSDIEGAPTNLSEFYNDTGFQTATQVVQITKDTVTSPFIKALNLSVGDEILMGENATISWSKVTDTDDVATQSYVTGLGYQTAEQVTSITKNTITTSYINALNITAGSVACENLTGTTISGKDIILGGENNGDGSITVKDSDGNIMCTIGVDGIQIQSEYITQVDESTLLSGSVLASGVSSVGFTISNNRFVSECSSAAEDGTVPEEATIATPYFSGIKLDNYTTMTITTTAIVGNAYGTAYVNCGIDEANVKFFELDTSSGQEVTYTIELDVSGYTGYHNLVFYQYAKSDSDYWGYASHATLGIHSITLS